MHDLSFIGRSFDQLCFVVEDLEAAVETWTNTFGITAWSVWEGLSVGQTEKTYRGEPAEFEFSVAYGFAGDVLIELARHDSGSSVYKDWLDEKGVGPHHIGFRVSDAAEYAAAEEAYVARGISKAMSGFIEGSGVGRGSCRWGYFDTRQTLGCYTEIYYLDPELVVSMERMKRGEIFASPPL
ncbi:MAG: VOC family protein [Actinomycetes bacterium]